MRNKRLLGTIVGVLVVAIVAFLVVGLLLEDSLPGRLLRGTAVGAAKQPTYAEAVVDGNAGEWDLAKDFFADMYRAGKSDKGVEAKIYLRYDCGAGLLYVLVLSAGDWPVLVQDNEAWVALDNNSSKVTFTAFSWIDQGYDGNGGHARGWEASFAVPQGTRTLFAHVNVDHGGSQTAATDRTGIGLKLDCYTPTAVFLGNLTATAKRNKVLVRWETTSEVSNLGFNVYFSTSPDGPWTQLNQSLIPSLVPPGSPTGARYKYEHVATNPNTPRFYLLEDIDSSGVATRHGPVSP